MRIGSASRPAWVRSIPAWAVLSLAVGLAGLAWVWVNSRPGKVDTASHDPRLNYSGPFLNIHPSVQYVGDQACMGCHDTHLESFAKHPMGQAMSLVSDASKIEKYDAEAKNPFVGNGFAYQILRSDQGVSHREGLSQGPGATPLQNDLAKLFLREKNARFAVGSGAKARSYLMEQDGYLFQSPCTWYRREARWDLSPSFEVRNQHFTRTVTPGCLFCHANQADHVEGTENRYREPIFHGLPIGCERCHGPGEKHVQARLDGLGPPKGQMDPTLVNPKWLEHSLRQAVCEQCHVQGEQRVVGRGLGEFDFRPGLPLQDFLMDFVDRRQKDGGFKFVSSVEQMMQSRCYQATAGDGKMGCTSCHDPHASPETLADKVTHYRQKCLACHSGDAGKPACAVSEKDRRTRQPADYCVACHMPQNAAEVNHASITDHSIPRVPPPDRPAGQRPTAGPHDLIPFHAHLVKPDSPEVQRNTGLARMAMLNMGLPPGLAREMAAAALEPLRSAMQRDPADWPAVEGWADAMLLNDRPEEARQAYRRAVAARPHYEKTRLGAGAVALSLGLLDEAVEELSAAVRINPFHPGYQHDLAVACLRQGDYSRAEKACRSALAMEPSREKTRSLLILVLLRIGRHDAATAELDLLRLTTPPAKLAELDQWFAREKSQAPTSR